VLEQAESDVLILLDCCHAATATTSEGNGVTEMISACAYNATANGVGYYSFTRELTIELRELSRRPSFTVAHLFRNAFSRIQARRPEDGRERHPAPVHFSLTQDNPEFPRSIQLSVRPGHKKKPRLSNDEALTLARMLGSDPKDVETATGHRGVTFSRPVENEQLVNDTNEAFSVQPISKLPFQTPRILLAVRLKDDCCGAELSINLFKNWLRDMPTVAEEVKVEAGFGSYSSIVIVSIPLALSLYLRQDPAVIKIGPITSENLLQQSKETQQTKQSAPTPTWASFLLPVVLLLIVMRSLVDVAFPLIADLRSAEPIELAWILVIFMLIFLVLVLNGTIDFFISTSNICRQIAYRASFWSVHIRGKFAQKGGLPVPGSSLSTNNGYTKPDHPDHGNISVQTHKIVDEVVKGTILTPHAPALQKRTVEPEARESTQECTLTYL